MDALRYVSSKTGLELQRIPIPEPGPGQALIRVEAAGLCHSDTTILKGEGNAWIRPGPITLGHEVAGTVVKLGDGPSSVEVGDRVAVAIVAQPVENADWSRAIGLGHDGGYAQFAVTFTDNLVRIPDGVEFEQAASATDAIATAYHAVMTEARVAEGTTVAIIGLGGLGLNGVALAALTGAKVYGVDVNIAKFEDAKQLGAIECVSTLADLRGIIFDAVVDFAGKPSTISSAVSSVRRRGRVVLVGLGSAVGEFQTSDFVTRGITLQGSVGASLDEYKDVLGLIAAGKIRPKLREIPFADVEKGLRSLDSNEVVGRLFCRPNSAAA